MHDSRLSVRTLAISDAHADEDTEMVYVASPPAVYADHVTATTSDVQAAK